MLPDTFIQNQFDQLPASEQVQVLMKAIVFMKEDSERHVIECLALAMDIPLFPKVGQILEKNGYQLTLLFTHGEERIIDFQVFFSKESRYQKILLEDINEFNKVKVDYDTLIWPEIGFWDKDVEGNEVFHNYDIDPGMLYEASEPIAVSR